jgi:hypothetical protein
MPMPARKMKIHLLGGVLLLLPLQSAKSEPKKEEEEIHAKTGEGRRFGADAHESKITTFSFTVVVVVVVVAVLAVVEIHIPPLNH